MRFMGGKGVRRSYFPVSLRLSKGCLPCSDCSKKKTRSPSISLAIRQWREFRDQRLIWIASLILLFATPAQAYPGEPSDYSYCRVELPVAGQTLTATRTLWADGKFAFQTSYDPVGKALIQTKQPHFMRAYLTWRPALGDARGDPKLWVVMDDWIFNFADDFRLYARPPKSKADAEIDLGKRMAKDGFNIFDVELQALLRAFPDAAEVQLSTHAPGKNPKSGRYDPPKGSLNLSLLRAQVAALADVNAALDREQALPGACKAVQPSGFEETDVANWNWCRFDLPAVPGGGPGLWSDGHRLMSGLRLGKHAYLDLSHSVSDGKDGHAFLSKGFEGAKIFPYQLRYVASVYAKAQRLTLTSGTETLAFDLAKGQDQISLNWADLLRLDKTGAEIRYRQAYSDGTLLGEGSLPPGSFRALEAQMQKAYQMVLDKRKDPITHCSPPPPIIVT
jgi:hypothetical protein